MSLKPVRGMEVHAGDVSVYILINRLKFGDGQMVISFLWSPENVQKYIKMYKNCKVKSGEKNRGVQNLKKMENINYNNSKFDVFYTLILSGAFNENT